MFQSESTHQIAMLFSPPVLGCLLKKSSRKGGGVVTGIPGPRPTGSGNHTTECELTLFHNAEELHLAFDLENVDERNVITCFDLFESHCAVCLASQ